MLRPVQRVPPGPIGRRARRGTGIRFGSGISTSCGEWEGAAPTRGMAGRPRRSPTPSPMDGSRTASDSLVTMRLLSEGAAAGRGAIDPRRGSPSEQPIDRGGTVESEPTAELIRAQLRRLRLAADLTQEDFGRQVHFSGSQISAIELGQRPFDRLFLKRADEVLNSDGLLLGLLRIAELHGQPHFLRPWLDAERNATQLRCYHPTLVPGLLQTEHYARAVIRADDMLSDDEVERRLAVRMDRQAILTRPDPPILIAVIEEATLRRADESFRGIMTQQIGHLLDCVKRGGVLIHVISAEVSVHVGLDGPFALARGPTATGSATWRITSAARRSTGPTNSLPCMRGGRGSAASPSPRDSPSC
ncbi:hypothetical protein GCM10029963_46440 [Micromonospora andamanensis]